MPQSSFLLTESRFIGTVCSVLSTLYFLLSILSPTRHGISIVASPRTQPDAAAVMYTGSG